MAGLETSTIGTGGFMPIDRASAEALLQGRVGPSRAGQRVAIGVGGFDVGNMAFFAKSIKTTLGTGITSDGIVSATADFQVTTSSPGLLVGITIFSPHGAAALSSHAVYSLTFTNVPGLQQFAIRKAGGTTLSAAFQAGDGNNVLKNRIESIFGGTVTIGGMLTTSTTATETLYSGVLTATFAMAANMPGMEVISGEVQTATVGTGFTSGTYNGAGLADGDTAATFQAALRLTGGNYAGVLVSGSSS